MSKHKIVTMEEMEARRKLYEETVMPLTEQIYRLAIEHEFQVLVACQYAEVEVGFAMSGTVNLDAGVACTDLMAAALLLNPDNQDDDSRHVAAMRILRGNHRSVSRAEAMEAEAEAEAEAQNG